jgi:cold shock CspA family protein
VSDDLGIRRPELLGQRRCGTVRWFKDEKGYGRITADDGEVLWFHHSSIIAEGYRSAEAGQRFSFIWKGHTADHGRHAAEDLLADEPLG